MKPHSISGPPTTSLISSAPARKHRGRKRRSRRRRKKKPSSIQPQKQHQQKTPHLAVVVQKQIEDLRMLLNQLGSGNRTRAKRASSRRRSRRWVPSGRVIHPPDPPLPPPAAIQMASVSDSLPETEAVPESDSDASDWEELAAFHDDLLIPGLQEQYSLKLLEQEEQEEAILQAAHEEIKEGFRFASLGQEVADHPQENHDAIQEFLLTSSEPGDSRETHADSQEVSHPAVSQELPADSQEAPIPIQENPDYQESPVGSQEPTATCQDIPIEELPLEHPQELPPDSVQRTKDNAQGATEPAPLFLEPVGNAQDISIQEAFLQATGLSMVGSEGNKLVLTSKVCSSMNSSKRTKRELKKLQFNVNYERNTQRKKGVS